MSEILNLDVLNPQSRKIVITKAGSSKLPVFLSKILRKDSSKKIEIDVPVPSFRQSQELTQKYIQFVQASLEYARNPLDADVETASKMQEMTIDIIVTALKPSYPPMSNEWVMTNLNDDTVAQIFEFVVRPIQDKIRKNAETLQGLMDKK